MRTFGVHKEILIAVDAHAVENLLYLQFALTVRC